MTVQPSTVKVLRALITEAEARDVNYIAVADLRAALDKAEGREKHQ